MIKSYRNHGVSMGYLWDIYGISMEYLWNMIVFTGDSGTDEDGRYLPYIKLVVWAYVREYSTKYGLIWYSTSILGS